MTPLEIFLLVGAIGGVVVVSICCDLMIAAVRYLWRRA